MQVDGNDTFTAAALQKNLGVLETAQINIDPGPYPAVYDKTPFSFTHNLHTLGMFQFDSICELAEKYSGVPDEYNIAGHAPSPGTRSSVSYSGLTPGAAMKLLDEQQIRILLKRPEDRDKGFRKLLDFLFQQIQNLGGSLASQRMRRLESAVLISSAATTTPLHFDPEIGFFSQIEGEKMYHVYSPNDVSETDLESFYIRSLMTICPLDMARRDPQNEHVFHLRPGIGFHQPQNSPHWVETRASRSISYTVVVETDATRARGRTRAFNHYERKLGLQPMRPGARPLVDIFKAEAMIPDLLVRKVARRLRSKMGR